MDKGTSWLEYALIIGIVVAAVILGIILLGPQIANPPNDCCPNIPLLPSPTQTIKP